MNKWLNLTRRRLTIVIVPDTDRKIKQFGINSLVLQTVILICIVVISAIVLYGIDMTRQFQSAEKLNAYYREQIANRDITIDGLHDDNGKQAENLTHLQTQLAESDDYFQSKVAEIAMLESELSRLIVKFNADNNTSVQMPISRSGNISRESNYFTNPTDVDETFGEDVISEEITAQVMRYTDLAQDIEAKLDYIDAKPDLLPADGRLSSPFGNRRDPFTRRVSFHKGIDLANHRGTPIHAAGAGVVTFAGRNQSYGNVVVIRHGYKYDSLYAHCTELKVAVGDQVEKGQLIATMGSTGKSTGPHLHFEIHYDKTHVDPLNILKAEE